MCIAKIIPSSNDDPLKSLHILLAQVHLSWITRNIFWSHGKNYTYFIQNVIDIKSCFSLTFSLAKRSTFLVTTWQSFVFQPQFKCRLVTSRPYCDYATKIGMLQIPVGRSALDLKITIYNPSAWYKTLLIGQQHFT